MSQPGKEKECIAIAKDALEQIRLKKFIPTHGTYVRGEGIDGVRGELQKHLIRRKKPCQVCALGAALLSTVRKFNKFKLQNRSDSGAFEIEYGMRSRLREFFSLGEIRALEAAFEGWVDYANSGADFGNLKHASPIARQKQIFNFIVKNNGSFDGAAFLAKHS